MRKRAAVHPFDIALGLVWLTIIFVGLIYLLSRTPAPEWSATAEDAADFDQKIGLLGELRSDVVLPSEEERLRAVAELQHTAASDDRASIYPGHAPDVPLDEKLDMLQALRTAR